VTSWDKEELQLEPTGLASEPGAELGCARAELLKRADREGGETLWPSCPRCRTG